LTDFKLDVSRGVKHAELKSAVEKFDLLKKWENTPFARKIQRSQVRAKLSDFDRFKVMVLRKKVNLFDFNEKNIYIIYIGMRIYKYV